MTGTTDGQNDTTDGFAERAYRILKNRFVQLVTTRSTMHPNLYKGLPTRSQLSFQVGGFIIFGSTTSFGIFSSTSFGLVPNELDRREYHVNIPLGVCFVPPSKLHRVQ